MEDTPFEEKVKQAMYRDWKDDLISEIEAKKFKCPCGKYCVQEARNEGLADAQDIIKSKQQ